MSIFLGVKREMTEKELFYREDYFCDFGPKNMAERGMVANLTL